MSKNNLLSTLKLSSWKSLMSLTAVFGLVAAYATFQSNQQAYEEVIPPYCVVLNGATSSTTNYYEPISNVTFAGINQSSPATILPGNTPGITFHTDFTAVTGNVTAGTTYPISVAGAQAPSSSITVFIDWNQDNLLNGANEVYALGLAPAGGTFVLNASIAVPASALAGSTRMRVAKRWNGAFTDPCASATASWWGEVEDYSLTVVAAPVDPEDPEAGCVLTCPGNQYINLDPGACSYTYTYEISVTDECIQAPAPLTGFTGPFSQANSYLITAPTPNGLGATGCAPSFPANGLDFSTPGTLFIDAMDESDYALGFGNFCAWQTGITGVITSAMWVMPVDGQLTFNWAYHTTDNFAGLIWDYAGYLLADQPIGVTFSVLGQVPFVAGGGTPGSINQSGILSVPVTAGQYLYIMAGSDAVDDGSDLTITNFALQAAPVPPVLTQTSGVNIGYQADFEGGTVDVITEEFPIGTTVVTYTGNGADGTPLSCTFNVVVAGIANPIASLACNDNVNISVDVEDCEAVINADQILEGGPYGCYDDYIVAIGTNMQGPFNLGNTVTCANIGQTLAVQVTDPITGNRCWGWITVEDKSAPVIECGGCIGETNTLSGAFNINTGSIQQPACWAAIAGTKYYEALTFEPAATGTYTIGGNSPSDSYGILYNGVFDPANPCVGFIAANDDGNGGADPLIVANLVAGNTYTIVMSSYGTQVSSTYDWTFTGPGGSGILAIVPCEIACSAIDALLDATTLDDLAAIGIFPPTATDNCDGPACAPLQYTFTVGAISNPDMCAPERFIPVTFTVTDLGGNTASCTANIFVDLPTLDEVVFPDQVVVECGTPTDPDAFNSQAPDLTPFVPAFNPNALDGNTIDEDWPAVDGNDIRNQGVYCNLVSQYVDSEVLICGTNSNAKKIVRRWTVIDWCTNEIRESVQLIKAEDVIAPIVTCPPSRVVNASPWSCEAFNVKIAGPSVIDACTIDLNLLSVSITVDGVPAIVRSANPNVPAPNGNVVITLGGNTGFTPGETNTLQTALSVGEHTIQYSVTDGCNNVGTCSYTITVVDNTPPNIICKEFLQVTTNPNGCINLIPAKRFDNGSYDNCCSDDELVFKVRRMSEPNDSYFRDTIAVGVFTNRVMYNDGTPLFGNVNNSRESHDDLTGVVTGPYGEKFCGRVDVIMRVYCAGSPQYFADCMVQTFVDDKTRPIISAPANVIVHCEDDPTDNQPPHLSYDQYFGYASWIDPCGSVVFDSTITGTLNDCGEGTLVKTWRATDKCGNQDVKSQTVTVRHISDFEVIFPSDTMITACVDTQDFTPVPHDPIWWPRFDRNDCEQLATTWWDERFYGENDACFKIVRHWKVINWCTYNVDLGNTFDDYSYRAWRLPITCKWRPSSINQFTANDCNLWRPDIYRRIQDGEYFRAIDPTPIAGAQYDPNYRGDGVVEYIQVIKVKDNENPIIQVNNPKPCPEFGTPVEEDTYSDIPTNTPTTPWVYNVIGTLYNGICSAPSGTLKASAIDCSNKLNYHYEVDAFASTTNLNLKSIDFSGLTPVITDIIPMGLHRVYWTVSDNCGNVASGNYWVRLRDCKKPSPVCFNGLATVVMPSSGSISLPATYFDHQSFDNCTPHDELIFSYSADVNETVRTWTCDDIIANGSPIFEVTIYVTDGDGNQDFCNTFIRIDDNDNVCDSTGTLLAVQGNVLTYSPVDGIKDVVINYASTPRAITVDATGSYNFKANNTDAQRLEGRLDKDFLNGVNVGDIIKIQNHILGKTALDQPYKLLAADVVADGEIKVSDIVEIRKLILGKTDKFTSGKSWRTFDANYALTMNNWTSTPDYVMAVPALPATVVDLRGVKLGDVDLSAKANFSSGAIEQRTVGTLNFRADDVQLTAGQTIEIPVKAKDFKNIAGYQFTFAFDQSAVEFVDMKAGALAINAENFSADRAAAGIVTTAFNSNEAATVADDEVLFTLVFNTKSEVALSSVLSANSSLTPAMGVNANDEILDIALEFNTNNGTVTAGGFDLKQNTPNPFSTVTAIEYNLPEASKATLTIYDVTGKIVYSKKIDAAKGLNKELVSRTQIGSTGVMFYQLVAGDYSATKKMVILD